MSTKYFGWQSNIHFCLALTMRWTPRHCRLTGCRRCLPLHQASSCSCSIHLSHANYYPFCRLCPCIFVADTIALTAIAIALFVAIAIVLVALAIVLLISRHPSCRCHCPCCPRLCPLCLRLHPSCHPCPRPLCCHSHRSCRCLIALFVAVEIALATLAIALFVAC
jgi:hypothetical protein